MLSSLRSNSCFPRSFCVATLVKQLPPPEKLISKKKLKLYDYVILVNKRRRVLGKVMSCDPKMKQYVVGMNDVREF